MTCEVLGVAVAARTVMLDREARAALRRIRVASTLLAYIVAQIGVTALVDQLSQVGPGLTILAETMDLEVLPGL